MTKIKTSHNATITVNTPKLEKQVDIKVSPGTNVRFAFDTSSAIFGREGNSLVITSQDGGVVRLVDYFVVGKDAAESANNLEALPNFELADGTVISGPDFLLALSENLDIKPAAGPEASPKSNGSSQYQDDPGVLLGGIDRLGAVSYTHLVFTLVPDFFAKCGFKEFDRDDMPPSVWVECSKCPKFYCCDEIAMLLPL